jgi:hypothetical protein
MGTRSDLIEKLIDQLVYELYSLTDDEIRIVEEETRRATITLTFSTVTRMADTSRICPTWNRAPRLEQQSWPRMSRMDTNKTKKIRFAPIRKCRSDEQPSPIRVHSWHSWLSSLSPGSFATPVEYPPRKPSTSKPSKPAKKSGNRVALFAKSVTFCPRAQPRTKKSRPSPDAEKSAGQRKTASDCTEPNSQTPLHQLPALIYS